MLKGFGSLQVSTMEMAINKSIIIHTYNTEKNVEEIVVMDDETYLCLFSFGFVYFKNVFTKANGEKLM